MPYNVMQRRIGLLYAISVALLLFSCNAPHDNPFDPLSSEYQTPEEAIASSLTVQSKHYRLSAWLEDLYWLTITAQFDDPDVIDSAWIAMDTLQLGTVTPIANGSHTWMLEIYENDLYDQYGLLLEGLIGHNIRLYRQDSDGSTRISDPFTLKRIVDEIPATVSPGYDNPDLTNLRPTLVWEQYFANFNFSYEVEIVHVATSGFPSVVYNYNGISADDTTHTVVDALQTVSGDAFYYWTLKVVDDFGNVARSLETQFRIVEDE